MRFCGVGAIEAQIAAGGYGDGGSNRDDSVVVTGKGDRQRGGNQTHGYGAAAVNTRIDKGDGKKLPAEEGDGKLVGGLRGILSSARSLGWGWRARKKGRKDNDVQSQSSPASGRSLISGGLRLLSSTAGSIFRSLRSPSPTRDEGNFEVSSDLTSMPDTDSDDDGRGSRKAAILWRRVRLIVTGVRGLRGAVGDGARLERTMTYQAARRIQGMVRVKLARKSAAEKRSAALAARRRGEDLRRQRRQREADARKRYREACRAEGKRILDWSVKVFLQPRAVVDLQRVWRGHRARKRMAAYVQWLENRARRRREYQRYLAALAARRAAAWRNDEQVKRRVWGRVEFAHTGWRPRYEADDPPDMHDHVWTPPRGSSSGVRTLKVLLPPATERDRLTLTGDKNAWAGVPVGITDRKPRPERFGPSPRPGTITAAPAPAAEGARGRGRAPPLSPVGVRVGGSGETEGGVLTRYNWIPATLVGKAALLQIPVASATRTGTR